MISAVALHFPTKALCLYWVCCLRQTKQFYSPITCFLRSISSGRACPAHCSFCTARGLVGGPRASQFGAPCARPPASYVSPAHWRTVYASSGILLQLPAPPPSHTELRRVHLVQLLLVRPTAACRNAFVARGCAELLPESCCSRAGAAGRKRAFLPQPKGPGLTTRREWHVRFSGKCRQPRTSIRPKPGNTTSAQRTPFAAVVRAAVANDAASAAAAAAAAAADESGSVAACFVFTGPVTAMSV